MTNKCPPSKSYSMETIPLSNREPKLPRSDNPIPPRLSPSYRLKLMWSPSTTKCLNALNRFNSKYNVNLTLAMIRLTSTLRAEMLRKSTLNLSQPGLPLKSCIKLSKILQSKIKCRQKYIDPRQNRPGI